MPIQLPSTVKFYDPAAKPYTSSNRVSLWNATTLRIIYPFDRHINEKVKTIRGWHFDGYEKAWTVPLTSLAEVIRTFPLYHYSTKLRDLLEAEQAEQSKIDAASSMKWDEIKKAPFPFQRDGIEIIRKRKASILADEMGLGKTLQAIAWAYDKMPVLVVCPASLKLNWKREISEARPADTIQVVSSKINPDCLLNWNIVNYDVLDKMREDILACKFQAVIVDEAHYIKNSKAKRTELMLEMATNWPYRLLVTGTPIDNRPVELFTLLRFVGYKTAADWKSFVTRYCGAYQKNIGYGRTAWDVSGATNLDELREHLKPVVLRRLKKDVLKDLPPKLYETIPVELSNRREYVKAETDLIRWLTGIGASDEKVFAAQRAEILVRISYLRQLAAKGKIDHVVEMIENIIAEGNKAVVFFQWKETLHAVRDKLTNPVVFSGDETIEQRQAAVDAFQRDPNVMVFLGTIDAAGVGITLTAGHIVLIPEFPWTPGRLAQAEDRLARIGQKYNVLVKYIVASATIDEHLGSVIRRKKAIIDQALDADSLQRAASGDNLRDLISGLTGKAMKDMPAPELKAEPAPPPTISKDPEIYLLPGPSLQPVCPIDIPGIPVRRPLEKKELPLLLPAGRKQEAKIPMTLVGEQKRMFVVPCTFRGKRTTCRIAPREQARMFQSCTLAQDVNITGKCIEGACKIKASKMAAVDVHEIAKIPEAVEKLKKQEATAKGRIINIEVGDKVIPLRSDAALAILSTIQATKYKEMGHKFCKHADGTIGTSLGCKGGYCSVNVGQKTHCGLGTQEVGHFHTHPETKTIPPSATIIPSGGDLQIAKRGGLLHCVGSPTADAITCYRQKENPKGPAFACRGRHSYGYLKASLPGAFKEEWKKLNSMPRYKNIICKNVEHNFDVTEIPLENIGAILDEQTARLSQQKSLRIPPSWRDVSTDPAGDVVATGIDSKGRKQRIYSAGHWQRVAAEKFSRLVRFQEALPYVRSKIVKDAPQSEEALILYIIDKTGFRIGSSRETLATVKAFGVSTLEGRHVRISENNNISFDFVGKKGVRNAKTINDAFLARLLRRTIVSDNERLFSRTDNQVRAYLTAICQECLVKDFRTWHGTRIASELTASMPTPQTERDIKRGMRKVAQEVAAFLGNTPAVALSAYIDPGVFDSWQKKARMFQAVPNKPDEEEDDEYVPPEIAEIFDDEAELRQEVKIKGKCADAQTCQFKVTGGDLKAGQAASVADLPGAIDRVRQAIQKARGPKVTDKTFAIGPSRRRYDFRHRIVDAKDLIVSHDPFTFQKNPAYPESLQPRRRERAAQQLQVKRIASELDPEVLLLDFRSLEKGSPIVGPA